MGNYLIANKECICSANEGSLKRGDMVEVVKWMRGFNVGDIIKVLIVSEPGRTQSNGFKLEKFWFTKDIYVRTGLSTEW